MFNRTSSNVIELNRILPNIFDSIVIRLRSTIELQLFDHVRLFSIDSIAISVRFRSIDIVWKSDAPEFIELISALKEKIDGIQRLYPRCLHPW